MSEVMIKLNSCSWVYDVWLESVHQYELCSLLIVSYLQMASEKESVNFWLFYSFFAGHVFYSNV